MFLNRTHPNFDLEMELLCTLSPSTPAMLSALAADLGYDGANSAGQAVKDLRKRGFEVCTGRGEKTEGNVAYIERIGREHIEAACEKYWNSVYGSPKTKAKAA